MKETRRCFVIMPFGEKPDGKVKVDFEKIYDGIIRPAVESLKDEGIQIECQKCNRIELAGPIHERMIRHIVDDDVAVVDITTRNPNVFYELGVRHALRDRVTVLVRHKGTPSPFNISGMNTIEYDATTGDGADRARREIANFVRNGLRSSTRDSLVYSVIPGLRATADLKPIADTQVETYPVPGAARKRIGIVSGNLRHINMNAELGANPINVWVSSENINMQMARVFESSMSGLIRWLAAKKDATGHIVRDVLADELRGLMGRRQQVNPGIVVATGAGELAKTHKVKRIYHAASVYGTIGGGYHPIVNVEQCVTNALARADLEANPKVSKQVFRAKSLLFPVFGTGTARAQITEQAKPQVRAAINYLLAREDSTVVQRVYFLAPTEQHRSALRVALAELGVVREHRPPGTKKAAGQRATRTAAARRVARGAVTPIKPQQKKAKPAVLRVPKRHRAA